jgi:hypothetical protein
MVIFPSRRISSKSGKGGREPPLSPRPQFDVSLAQCGGEILHLRLEIGLLLRDRFAGIVTAIETLTTGLGELFQPLRDRGLGELETTSGLHLAHVSPEHTEHHRDLLVSGSEWLSSHRSPPRAPMTRECPRKSDARHASYTYDSLGNQTSITYPIGSPTWAANDTVNFAYDAASELSSVTGFGVTAIGATNTADGLPSAETLGASGDSIDTSYDEADSPSSITLTNGSTVQEFSYSDEPSGAVAAETDTPSSAIEPADYTYDAQSRVTEMAPGTSSSFTYDEDPSDNLTTLPNGATGSFKTSRVRGTWWRDARPLRREKPFGVLSRSNFHERRYDFGSVPHACHTLWHAGRSEGL